MSSQLKYPVLRRAVEEAGGSMVHLKKGHQHGAWRVTLDGKTGTFPWNDFMFNGLDEVHRPKISNPSHYDHFYQELLPDWRERLNRSLNEKNGVRPLPSGRSSRSNRRRRVEERETTISESWVDPEQLTSLPKVSMDAVPTVLPPDNADLTAEGGGKPQPAMRGRFEIARVIRDTKVARDLKALYQNHCQICGLQIKRGSGEPYSEVHHIQPLGCDGPDVQENMLVLCPNHHAEFDYGSIALHIMMKTVLHIDPGYPWRDAPIKSRHVIGAEYLQYHFDRFYKR